MTTTTSLAPDPWREAASLRALAEPPAPAAMHAVEAAAPSNLLGVDDDVSAVRAFLAEYQAQPTTFRSYVKEAERFLLWLTMVRRTDLRNLSRADLGAYSAFLADPQPREQWCGPKRGRLAKRFSRDWRPFVGPLTPAAQRSAFIVLNVMLKYLVHARYLAANPLALMRPQSLKRRVALTPRAQVSERVLGEAQWQAVRDSVAPLPLALIEPLGEAGARLARERARERFVVAMLYFLALRIGELTSHQMKHFQKRRGRWSFFVVGKGNKPAEIPVNDALLAELQAFRTAMQWSPLPSADDERPLVPRTDGGPAALSARRVHQILADIFARAADRLQDRAPEEALHLRSASPHWLRHTSLTRQIQAGLTLQEVKANARHSKLDTTLLYLHQEDDARHDRMQVHAWSHEGDEPDADGRR